MSALPELAATYYSQWDPDHVGTGDCVPTSAKMLLRYYTGAEIPIRQLRDEMDLGPDGVRNLGRDAGITLDACRIALGLHGISATAVWARDLSFERLLAFVQAGRLPIIFELHQLLTTRMDRSFSGLHAVWLTGVDGGAVEVKDPDRWGPHKADRWLVPTDELRSAWEAGAGAGGGAVIPDEPRTGWEDDMAFTDEDRQRLDRILAILEAREALVWAARAQRGLDVERQNTPFDHSTPPIDPRI